MTPAGRRLTLSPIGFDILLALSQTSSGLRLAELAHVIGSPVSSVQTSLRVLVANEIVKRLGGDPPRYVLSGDHPARDALVSTSTVIGDPGHAIAVILRASPAVGWAAVDHAGFLVGIAAEPPAGSGEALEARLAMIAESRRGTPDVVRLPMPDLDRLVRVALELRARVQRAVTIKGRPPVPAKTGPGPEQRRRAV